MTILLRLSFFNVLVQLFLYSLKPYEIFFLGKTAYNKLLIIHSDLVEISKIQVSIFKFKTSVSIYFQFQMFFYNIMPKYLFNFKLK